MSAAARRLAVLVSGGGRSLENLQQRILAKRLDASIGLVLSDRADAGALGRAERLGLPHRVVPWPGRGQAPTFSQDVFRAIEDHGCDLVVLAGFLRLLPIPPAWRGRVLNIHPSLLPAFGGRGFYGDRVHAAALARGVQYSGCTVHFVDDAFDEGPIVLQRVIEVRPDDDVESLAARVFAEEQEALPEAVRRVLDGESSLERPR